MTDKTILIADDDSELCHALALRCRRLGLTAITSTSGNRALHLAESLHPDLICLDIDMPGGNGLAVCEMLAGNQALATTPVIILSGRRDTPSIERCRSLGASYLAKSGNTWSELEPLILRSINQTRTDLPDARTMEVTNALVSALTGEELRAAIFAELGSDQSYLLSPSNQ